MRAALCVDIEPDEHLPAIGSVATWGGAEAFVADEWLRKRLRVPVVNWFLRIDHQVEVLHGRDTWAVTRFLPHLERFLDAGDEIGVHPHNWRLVDGGWWGDASDAWMIENAQRAIAGYVDFFGSGPKSVRYGDRAVSAVVVDFFGRSGVRVDLTSEPGTPTCRTLVAAGGSIGVIPHIDPRLSRRYRPSPDAVDLPTLDGGLTMVPLTTALVPGTGVIDTLQLWRDPAEFAVMLRYRLFDPDLDHLAFAIRSDLRMHSWAVERVEQNMETLRRSVPDLEWVQAVTLALDDAETPVLGLGIVGGLGAHVARLEMRVLPAEQQAAALRVELAEVERVVREVTAASEHDAASAEAAHAEVSRLSAELAVIEATLTWRLRRRLLPIFGPVVRALRRFRTR